MARHVKNELDWKHKSKEEVTLGTKMFGFVRNLYVKRGQSEFVTAETVKNFDTKVRQEQTKATYFLLSNRNNHLM